MAPEQGRADPIALDDRQAVEEAADVPDVAVGRLEVERREDDLLRRATARLAHGHGLVQPHLRVAARDPVELDPALTADLLVGDHRPTEGAAPALDLQDVAGRGVELLQIFGPHAGEAAAHVLALGLGDSQLERGVVSYRHGQPHAGGRVTSWRS